MLKRFWNWLTGNTPKPVEAKAVAVRKSPEQVAKEATDRAKKLVAEHKKEAAKAEAAAVKPTPVEAPKPAPVKVEEPKVEVKVEAPKVEIKAEQPKVEAKVEQPKVEVKAEVAPAKPAAPKRKRNYKKSSSSKK